MKHRDSNRRNNANEHNARMKTDRSRRLLLLAILLPVLVMATGWLAAGPPPEEPVRDRLAGCRVLQAIRQGALTIVPLALPVQPAGKTISTLDEAMSREELTVEEKDGGAEVNELLVSSRSKLPVFIMAGEILAGAKQNRILQEDVLILPGQVKTPVKAFCVEHGRWSGSSQSFHSEKNAAPVSVRKTASQKKEQGEVWREVAENNVSVQAESSSGSLSASYQAPAVKKAKDDLAAAFRDLPGRFPEATGVAVLINGRILVADLFGSRPLFEKMWDKLLESYLVEAARRGGEKQDGPAETARTLLQAAAGAAVTYINGPGGTRLVKLESAGATGEGLLLPPALVHLAIYPAEATAPAAKTTPLQRQYPSRNDGLRQESRR